MSKIDQFTISSLCMEKIDNSHIEVRKFLIPSYQRGYRWSEIQVNALLNDVYDFYGSRTDAQAKYCLQPIVVTRASDAKSWEVIDGQQRLTTLWLVLNYLNEEDVFSLYFESRKDITSFMNDLVNTKRYSHDTPELHFLSEAYRCIETWFEKQKETTRGIKRLMANTLANEVDIIWYDIESSDRKKNIAVFNNLNDGKIPLTDAELVKALILSKLKGKYEGRELEMRKTEIMASWCKMEKELRRPDKWNFLVGEDKKEYSSRIELLFDLIAENLTDKGNYTTFIWFEKQINVRKTETEGNRIRLEAENAERIWKQIENAFAIINSWFCESDATAQPVIYHYVGYLLSRNHKKIDELFMKASTMGKKEFVGYLKKTIVKIVTDGGELSELSYDKNHSAVHNILLLFNVLTCLTISRGPYNRFPFDRYREIMSEKGNSWSLEHVHAQNSDDPIQTVDAARIWANDVLRALKGVEMVCVDDEENVNGEEIPLTETLEELKEISESSNMDMERFNSLKMELENIFNGETIHDLCNMALISKKDNSALNKSIFPVKRAKIIELEKAGKFIPPCTKNVFLKFYSNSVNQPFYWGVDDQRSYFNEIEHVINEFITNDNEYQF